MSRYAASATTGPPIPLYRSGLALPRKIAGRDVFSRVVHEETVATPKWGEPRFSEPRPCNKYRVAAFFLGSRISDATKSP